ncbi:MAG: Asd/ArgC dimerization domain-containing protein, partial [Nitrospinota bacterium]
IILALAPLLSKGLVRPETIISDSKSGVSGAGRALKEGNLFNECDEDFKAYSPLMHRHTPEIEQELTEIAGSDAYIMFTPHLLPMKRGILSTIYVELLPGVSVEAVEKAYNEVYGNERFVRFLGAGHVPRTRNVAGTNFCHIGMQADERSNRLVLFSAIDNIGKGACGQAVQNMNLMFSLEEGTGLMEGALVP